MLSGAFYDALSANLVAPAWMIFVPCRDGFSHNEAEHVEPSDIVIDCEVPAAPKTTPPACCFSSRHIILPSSDATAPAVAAASAASIAWSLKSPSEHSFDLV
ncbi:hypothetical protein D4A92_23135 (plasmid) [Rhizobium rosettiformans]|uniref:Uncharacterized protein n=1 Tax=Rhizobium rosettiformans TaxID=1368430 RepID=A0ABX7F4B5_9HYPH|nr:hypothetical protein D4A92_23135 [Rhizobium rosettiformans]